MSSRAEVVPVEPGGELLGVVVTHPVDVLRLEPGAVAGAHALDEQRPEPFVLVLVLDRVDEPRARAAGEAGNSIIGMSSRPSKLNSNGSGSVGVARRIDSRIERASARPRPSSIIVCSNRSTSSPCARQSRRIWRSPTLSSAAACRFASASASPVRRSSCTRLARA